MKTKILIITLLLAMTAFACSKKIELTRIPEPFMMVNLYPFIVYEDKSYEDIGIDYQSIDRWNPPAKRFREEGSKFLYYSELDSNTLIFLSNATLYSGDFCGTAAIYLIRTCNTDEECEAYEKEHSIIDVFKYEFMRFQREGLYRTSREYADSISDNIINKFKEYHQTFEKEMYKGLVYNDRCALGDDYGAGEKRYYDFVSEAMIPCPMIPQEVHDELDSCNAMLEAQDVKKIPLLSPKNTDFEIKGRHIEVNSRYNWGDVLIFSLMGQIMEQHHVSGQHTVITVNVPPGRYIVQLRSHYGAITHELFVR